MKRMCIAMAESVPPCCAPLLCSSGLTCSARAGGALLPGQQERRGEPAGARPGRRGDGGADVHARAV